MSEETKSPFLVVKGSDAGNIIDLLEETIEQVKAGDVEAVILARVLPTGYDIQSAWSEGMAWPDERLYMAARGCVVHIEEDL